MKYSTPTPYSKSSLWHGTPKSIFFTYFFFTCATVFVENEGLGIVLNNIWLSTVSSRNLSSVCFHKMGKREYIFKLFFWWLCNFFQFWQLILESQVKITFVFLRPVTELYTCTYYINNNLWFSPTVQTPKSTPRKQ